LQRKEFPRSVDFLSNSGTIDIYGFVNCSIAIACENIYLKIHLASTIDFLVQKARNWRIREMKIKCGYRENCMSKERQLKRCGERPEAFGHMRLIKGEEWKNIKFASKDARLSAVLVVAKTEPEPYEGFYVRRWDHPYEPNFETRTYNLLEFCQQQKVKNFFETGKAGNLIVWTRDEKTGRLYFIGTYKGILKLRKIEGYDRGKWKPRTALIATETYVVQHGKAILMEDFENEFKKRGLAFPSEKRISPYHSCYGRYVIGSKLARSIMKAIQKNAVKSEVYGNLAEPHTKEMLEKQKEIQKINEKCVRKINIDRFQKRLVTKQEMRYAKRLGIL
jgi:hypothetical protein